MADSKRLLVKKALTDILEGITVANGYQHELTSKVWRGRARIGEESEAPYLTIFEIIPEGPDQADPTVQKSQWDLAIKGYVKADRSNPTDPADNLMADVKMRLSAVMDDGGPNAPGPDFLLGGLINSLVVDNGVTFPPDETTDMAAFVMKVSLGFTEKLKDPYDVT